MFSGIVHNRYAVQNIVRGQEFLTMTLSLDSTMLKNLQLGASVCVDGVCLSVTKTSDSSAVFDVMQETLRVTTLGDLQVGDLVNIERSIRFGDEIGGHNLSGHIDGLGKVLDVVSTPQNRKVTLAIPDKLLPYIFEKGFLGVNGCSLTICNVDKKLGTLDLWLIPETLRRTSLEFLQVGDQVNLEIDRNTQIIVETTRTAIEKILGKEISDELKPPTNITVCEGYKWW